MPRKKSVAQIWSQANRLYNQAERQGRDVRASRIYRTAVRYTNNAFSHAAGHQENLTEEQRNRMLSRTTYMGLANG